MRVPATGNRRRARSRSPPPDPPRIRDAARGIQDLDGDEVALLVEVEDDTRLLLVALDDRRSIFEKDA